MRFRHRELDCLTRALDLVANQAFRQLAIALHSFDQPRRGKTVGRIPGNDLAAHVVSPTRSKKPKAAAAPRLRVRRKAEEIWPRKGGVGKRLPYLLGRRSDVDDVNRFRFEPRSVDHACTARLLSSSVQ